jgi:hypothetical protein
VNPFILIFILFDELHNLILVEAILVLFFNILMTGFDLFVIFSSNLVHESSIDDILAMKNLLVSNLQWKRAKFFVFDVKVPLPDRLVPNAKVQVTVESKNI